MSACINKVESTTTIEVLNNSAVMKKRYGNCGKLILNKDELLRLLDMGAKRSEIARLYGVDRSAVTKAMRRMAA